MPAVDREAYGYRSANRIRSREAAGAAGSTEATYDRHRHPLQAPAAVALMAYDLATTPSTGPRVRACGDCHLLNCGMFATPERNPIFDMNDFDETLPAPWEWDVRRLGASFTVAARDSRCSDDEARDAAIACARGYREHLRDCSKKSPLEVWYERLDVQALIETAPDAKVCTAARQPNMRFVAMKSVEQQAASCVHRLCQGLVEERTALMIRPRGLLTEFTVVAPVSPDKLRREPARCQDPEDARLPPTLRQIVGDLSAEMFVHNGRPIARGSSGNPRDG